MPIRRTKPKFKLPSVHTKSFAPIPFVPEEDKTLEQRLPSKDLAALHTALEQIRTEIFNTIPSGSEAFSPTGTLSYSLTIDGSIHFDTGQVSSVKMEIENSASLSSASLSSSRVKDVCVVDVTMHTDVESMDAIKNIFNNYVNSGVHQYTVRLFKGEVLYRSIQLYDTRITNYFSEIEPDGSVTIHITLVPNFWHI